MTGTRPTGWRSRRRRPGEEPWLLPESGTEPPASSPERLDRVISLLLVAGTAGERQVRDPVRPALRPGPDVVDFQRNVLCPAVGAGPAPLLQEILPDLVPGQGALLVIGSGNLRIFHLLHIESDQFLADGCDGSQFPKPIHPGRGRVDPVLQGGRKSSLRLRPVVETRLPVPEVGPSPSAERPSGRQPVPDLAAPVFEFGQDQDMGRIFDLPRFERNNFLFPDQGDAGALAPRIELDPGGLNLPTDSSLETDGKGSDLVDHRLPPFRQLPCPCRVAGHQGILVFVEHKCLHGPS